MLLTNLKSCRIDECEKVERSCVIVIVGRDRRECAFDCFGREIISVHDIGFRDVVNVVTHDVVDKTEGVVIVIIVGVGFSSFVCFVRTCS